MGRRLAVSARCAATEGDETASDGAGTRSVTVDAELVLDFNDDREVTLHVVTPQGDRELGTFDHVRDAWAAVDRIDLQGIREAARGGPRHERRPEGRRAT